jgi:aspartate kinase
LSDAGINVDMIVQNISEDGRATDMTFTLGRSDVPRAMAALESAAKTIGIGKIMADTKVAKVSVIGVGMRSHVGVAQRMFQSLGEKGINIQVITTSEIKVAVLIAEEYLELAVRSLHTAFGLDAS